MPIDLTKTGLLGSGHLTDAQNDVMPLMKLQQLQDKLATIQSQLQKESVALQAHTDVPVILQPVIKPAIPAEEKMMQLQLRQEQQLKDLKHLQNELQKQQPTLKQSIQQPAQWEMMMKNQRKQQQLLLQIEQMSLKERQENEEEFAVPQELQKQKSADVKQASKVPLPLEDDFQLEREQNLFTKIQDPDGSILKIVEPRGDLSSRRGQQSSRLTQLHEMSPGFSLRPLPRSVQSSPRDWNLRKLGDSDPPFGGIDAMSPFGRITDDTLFGSLGDEVFTGFASSDIGNSYLNSLAAFPT